MPKIKTPWSRCAASFVICLVLVAGPGCATRTAKQEVGAVVAAPVAQLPPLPVIVQLTEPKPAGFFQLLLKNYFSE